MEYRRVGKSGLLVSELSLGTMMFGDQTDRATAEKITAMARDAGVNFIDTAEGYAGGKSEAMVGELLKGEREKWVIGTKVNSSSGPKDPVIGLSRRWMMRSLERSLKRLQTDYIDVWYLHHVDWDTPLEETVDTMADVIASGKVHYWGISNHRAWQIGELVRLADHYGAPRPIIAQPYYNAMNRMPENDLLPACEYFGLGVVPYSPLARGVLTGKYRPGAGAPEGSRAARNDRRIMQTEFREESMQAAAKIQDHAAAKGGSAIGFALKWVLANPICTGVLGGPRTIEHWQGYLDGMSYAYGPDDEALLDSLVAAGHPSTPGFTDPQYPVRGRPVKY